MIFGIDLASCWCCYGAVTSQAMLLVVLRPLQQAWEVVEQSCWLASI